MIDPGSLTSVVKTNVRSVTPVVTSASTSRREIGAGVAPDPQVADGHQGEDPERHRADPIEATAERSNSDDEQDDPGRRDDQADRGDPADPARHHVGELAAGGEVVGQAGRRVQPGVRRPGRREQRRHAHQPVAGLAEHRLGGHSDGRRPGRDHLGHRQRPEHADGHGDVDRRRDPDRDRHRPGQLADRVGEVPRGEGDDAEAEEGEERQRDADTMSGAPG